MKLTDAMKRCLRDIDRAGSAVLLNGAGDVKCLAAGEFLRYLPGTYLRLMGDGLLTFSEPRRLVLTQAAHALRDLFKDTKDLGHAD